MTANDARRAHDLLDDLDARAELSQEQEKLLRSFLPERPKQKTLEEIIAHVLDAWARMGNNCWGCNSYGPDVSIEDWLRELHAQLQGLMDTPANAPAHPEFLETEEDYKNAPVGTIVAEDNQRPAWKPNEHWFVNNNPFDNREMAGGLRPAPRRVLRWGWGE